MKPLVYVERVFVPLEQQYKYVSDESTTDSEDEEWTLEPKKKKKKDKDIPVNTGRYFISKMWIKTRGVDSFLGVWLNNFGQVCI